MNGTIDIDQAATGDERGLDPREAAALLKQTEQQARRQLDFDPPWASLVGAAIMIVLYGGLSLAARGEHPYSGPRGPWLLVLPAALIASTALRAKLFGEASTGLSGRTRRRMHATWAIMVLAVVAIYTLDAALKHAGASRSIVYGVFDASGPVLVFAAIVATCAVWRDDWPAFGIGIGLMFVAAGAAFAGPSGSWAVIGIGSCLVLLAHAAVKVWLQQREGVSQTKGSAA